MTNLTLPPAAVQSAERPAVPPIFAPGAEDAPADAAPAADHTAADADWWAAQNDNWHLAEDFDARAAEAFATDAVCRGWLPY